MKVAFLGPAGTFTEEALRASSPEPAEELPLPTVRETVMAVQRTEAGRAVVPIENSLEGPVTATLDTLASDAVDVRIAAEVVHPIHQCLVARGALPLRSVRRVVSHPQATAQCERFLRDRLGGAERVAAASTADAVREVAAASQPWAALGPRLAAELYGCRVLAENVEDHPDNLTRFVWLARAEAAVETGRTIVPKGRLKTSVVFWGFNDESPGALVAVLRELADRGVNLTKIESRPRRVRLGHYMFFADLEGGFEEPAITAALDALRRRVEMLRVLGSYPTR
jgi:prephenate dehydratase